MKKKLICALLALCIAATLAAFASSAEEHGHFYVDGVCECGERIEEKAAFALPGRAGTCTPLRASVTLPEGWAPTEKPIYLEIIKYGTVTPYTVENGSPNGDTLTYDPSSRKLSFTANISDFGVEYKILKAVVKCENAAGDIAVFTSGICIITPHLGGIWVEEDGYYQLTYAECGHTPEKRPVPRVEIDATEYVYRNMPFSFRFAAPQDMILWSASIEMEFIGWSVDFTEIAKGIYSAEKVIVSSDAESFDISICINTEDGYFYYAKKAVFLRDCVVGDASGDGEVDISDAMLVFYHVAKKESISWDALLRTDADKSGEVDIADAMKIFYYVAKKIDTLE